MLALILQFRVINYERAAFALSPGVRHKTGPRAGNVEHACIGSTGQAGHAKYCGDLAAFDYSGKAAAREWSVDSILTNTVFMIFYR